MKKTPDTIKYESNPFTLSFNALGRMFEKNALWAAGFVGLTLVWFFMQLFGQIFQAIFSNPQSSSAYTNSSGNELNAVAILAITILILSILLVVVISAIAISTFVSGLFSYIALESNQGRSVTASQGFNKALHRFWPLFKSQLLAAVKIFGWTLLFIIPGIVAFYRYSALPFVVMAEDETSASKIHARTKLLVRKRLWELFGISFVAGLIPVVGGLLKYTGTAALYQQMQVYTDGNIEKPKVHWLNYLGMMLLGAFAIFSMFIIAIIFIAIKASS